MRMIIGIVVLYFNSPMVSSPTTIPLKTEIQKREGFQPPSVAFYDKQGICGKYSFSLIPRKSKNWREGFPVPTPTPFSHLRHTGNTEEVFFLPCYLTKLIILCTLGLCIFFPSKIYFVLTQKGNCYFFYSIPTPPITSSTVLTLIYSFSLTLPLLSKKITAPSNNEIINHFSLCNHFFMLQYMIYKSINTSFTSIISPQLFRLCSSLTCG